MNEAQVAAATPQLFNKLGMRVGRHIGRTLYLTSFDDLDGDGGLIGVVDTPEIAAEIARRWNQVATTVILNPKGKESNNGSTEEVQD